MSGWKVVPVPPTKAMVHCANACAEGGSTAMDAGIAAAPEPNWGALAVTLINALYDESAKIPRDTADKVLFVSALRATFGSKP